MIDSEDYFVGFINSIESNEKEQSRYNPNLSNEDRISIDNLILLCPGHCADVDLHEKNIQ